MAEEEQKISFVGEDKLSDLLNDFGSQFENMSKQLDGLEAVAAKTAEALGAGMKDVARNTEAAGQGAEKSVGMFQNLGGSLADVAKGALSVATGMMGLQAATSVLGALTAGFSEFVEGEVAMTRLGAAVKASGADWESLKGKTTAVADSYMKLGIADESVMAGLQRLTEITGNYQQSLSLLPVAADMAAAKGMDLATAAQLVGRAAQGSTTMLARYGIVLREGASATEAIAAIQQKFAGQAEAMAGTVQGGLNRVQMMFREVGAAAIEAFGPALITGLTALANGLAALIPIAQQAGQAVVGGISAAAEAINLASSLQTNYHTALIATSGAAGTAGAAMTFYADSVDNVAAAATTSIGGMALITQALGEQDGAIATSVGGMTLYTQAAEAGATAALLLADSVAQSANVAAVANGTYNAAQSGMSNLTAKMGEAGAASAKFGDNMMKGTVAAAEAVKSAGPAIVVATTATITSMQQAWTTGLQGIGTVMKSHYSTMSQIANTFRIESVRAEAEYNNKRVALVAQGKAAEIAELDAGYGKARALRELDKQIAIVQAKAKYEAELAEQTKAFGQKMALWVQEAVLKGNISNEAGQIILNGLRTMLGAEVAAEAEAMITIVKLAEAGAAGREGAQERVNLALATTTEAYKKQTAAALALNAAQEGATTTEIEKLITNAYAAMGQFETGGAAGVGGGVAAAVERRAEEVVADIADTVESMLKSILEIKTTLQQKLPDIPGDVIGKWLDDLLSMTQQVADWAGPKGKGEAFGVLIKWFNSDLLPDLKSWGEIVGSMNTLFSGIKSIHETGSEKLAEMKTSVADFFNALGGLFADVNTYMGRVQGGGLVAITEPFQALDAQVVEWITSLQAGAEALGETLTSARAVIDALVDKLPATDKMGTSIGEIFVRIAGIFDAVREYTKDMAFGGGLISAPADIAAPLSEGLVAWLTSLQTSLEPLKAVLESARAIFGSLVEPIKAMGTSVGAMFDALKSVLEQMQVYAASISGIELGTLLSAWTAKGGLNETLSAWALAIAPMKALLEAVVSIIEIVTPELERTQMSVEDLFIKLERLMKDVETSVTGKVGDSIQGMVDAWQAIVTPRLEQWAEALAPLQTLLSVIKGILDMAANKVESVKMSVYNFFENLFLVLEAVTTQVEERVTNGTWQAAIDGFNTQADHIDAMVVVIGKLKPLIDAVAAICDVTGKRWPSFRLNLEAFFDQMLKALNVTTAWFMANTEGGEGINPLQDAIDGFNTIVMKYLWPLEMALENLSDAMNSMVTSATPLGNEGDAVRNGVNLMLEKLTVIEGDLLGWLKTHEFSFPSAAARLQAVVTAAMASLADAAGSIQAPTLPEDLLAGLAGGPGGKVGVDAGAAAAAVVVPPISVDGLTPTMDALVAMRDTLLAWLDENEGTIMGAMGRFITLIANVLQIIATGMGGGLTDENGRPIDATGMESGLLMELLNTVISLVQQILNQFQLLYAGIMSVRSLIGSISLAGAAQRMADSFVNKIQALIDAGYFYDIGYDAGLSFKQGFNDAVGIASPSKVMITAAKNIVNSFVMQAKSDADKMYQAGKSLGGAVEEGIRDALKMHSDSDVGTEMGQNFANSFNQAAWAGQSMGSTGGAARGGYLSHLEPTAAQRYMHQPGVDTAQAQWEREKLVSVSISPSITFAGAVSIRSDKDIEEIANQVSRKLASRFSSMNRWGAKV